jgi:hypothetical protein
MGKKGIFDHRCTQMHADEVSANSAKLASFGTLPLFLICVNLRASVVEIPFLFLDPYGER